MSLALKAYDNVEKQRLKKSIYIYETGNDSTALSDVRVRVFLRHSFLMSSLYPNNCLKVDTQSQGEPSYGTHNDWRVPGRPPMVGYEGNCFDSDIAIRFSRDGVISKSSTMYNNTQIWFSGAVTSPYTHSGELYYDDDDKVASYSYITPGYNIHNPKNMLLETKKRSVELSSLTTLYTDSSYVSTVKATTKTAHGFSDGMCISITGITTPDGKTDTSSHMFGYEVGQRYMGDFKITVVSDTEFTYQTFHLQNGTHDVTSTDNPNMCAEVWELCEYEDSITSISSDSSIITITLPTLRGEIYDFKAGDYISVKGTTGYNAHNMTIQSVDSSNTNILYVTKPATITSTDTETTGTVVYTPRLPSQDIPVNYKTSTITSCPRISHTRRTVLIYPDVDSYAERSSNCYDEATTLRAKYASQYPVIHFNIPTFDIPEEDIKCEFSVFANGMENQSNGISMAVGNLQDYELTSTSLASTILSHIDVSEPEIGTHSYDNYVTNYLHTYCRFNLDSDAAKKMISGESTHSLYIRVTTAPSGNSPVFLFDSMEAGESWPYLVIGLGSDIVYSSTLTLNDTYMYYLCNSISYDGTKYKVTVPGINDEGTAVYVRSGNYFSPGDEITVMHTIDFNTESATVTNVTYAGGLYTVEFTYNKGTPPTTPCSEGHAIIQNKSTIISAYVIDTGNIADLSEIKTVPEVANANKKLFNNGTEFDVKHSGKLQTLSVDVSTESGVETNEVYPIVMTDVDINNGRFSFISDGSIIKINGINFDKVSGIPYAIIGSHYLLNGYEDSEAQFRLTKNEDNTLQFTYGKSYGHAQLSANVIGARNPSTGITQFKVSADCEYNTGDVILLDSTPIYAINNSDNAQLPESSVEPFLYGKNFFITVLDDDANNCKWISLYAKFINKYSTEAVTAEKYVALSDESVEFINSICGGDMAPLIMYNGLTTLIMYDDNINTLSYQNRLYLAIDEYSPIIYSEESIYEVGDYFYIYVADNVNVDVKDSTYVAVQYLIADNDNRFKKYTFRSTTSGIKTYTFTDACGNTSSIRITIVDEPIVIELYNVKYLPDGTPILTFKVNGEHGNLTNVEASAIGEPGVYAEGTDGKYGNITEISDITEGSEFDFFYFDLRIDDIGDGSVIVHASTTEHEGVISSVKWFLPLVFSETLSCHHAGDKIVFNGINLDDRVIGGNTYTLGVNNTTWFSLTDEYSGDFSKVEIALSDTYIERHDFWPILNMSGPGEILSESDFPTTIEITEKPTITMRNSTVFVQVGETWSEPGDITAVDYFGVSILDSLTISGTVDTKTEGVYKLKYYAIDSCGQSTDELTRTIYVTAGCSIFIKTTSDTYKLGEEITFVIDDSVSGSDGGKFNQNYLNNIVTLSDMNGNSIDGVIIKATTDRKSLTIQSPGILGSTITAKIDTGSDNKGYESCYLSNVCTFSIVPKGEEDVVLGENMDSNSLSEQKSKFKNINYSPVYTKDLSYSTFSEVTDENSLVQNVYTILLTNLGERLYNDNFGSTLDKSIFSIISDINGSGKILTDCVKLIEKYESRVSVSIPDSYVNYDIDMNQIDINLYIKLPRGNAKKIELTFRNNA